MGRVKRRFEKVLDKFLVDMVSEGVLQIEKFISTKDSPSLELKYDIHFNSPEGVEAFISTLNNSKLYIDGRNYIDVVDCIDKNSNIAVILYSWDTTEAKLTLDYEKEVMNSLGIGVTGSDFEDLKLISEELKKDIYEVLKLNLF